MVIATSDSCNTLVSLESGNKHLQLVGDHIVGENVKVEYVETELVLPADEFVNDDGYPIKMPEQCVYLPSSMAVDEFFRHVPQLMEACDELLANGPRHFTKQSKDRVLYIAQGEVGHAVASQADVIVSDKATTCHILALRSESEGHLPLTSLTHIDGTSYETSVREMFWEHAKHHQTGHGPSSDRIQMDIHIVGGFEDEKGSSRKISCWLMDLLGDISLEQKNTFKMTIQTCAISSMNDTGHSCPVGRGMGINLRTGASFLARVDDDVAGPSMALRSVRIWASSGTPELALIHTSTSNDLSISPFAFQAFPEVEELLEMPDHKLVRFTSTSPDVEETDFCSSVRSTLKFLRDVDCSHVFGHTMNRPLVFQRVASNTWTRTL